MVSKATHRIAKDGQVWKRLLVVHDLIDKYPGLVLYVPGSSSASVDSLNGSQVDLSVDDREVDYYAQFKRQQRIDKRTTSLKPFKVHSSLADTAAVSCIALYRDKFVTGSQNRSVKLFEIDRNALKLTPGPENPINCLWSNDCFIPSCIALSDTLIAAGSYNGEIALYSHIRHDSSDPVHRYETSLSHTAAVTCIEIHGRFVYSGDESGVVLVWSENGLLLKALKDHTESISSICGYAGYIATGSADQTLRIWDVSSATLFCTNITSSRSQQNSTQSPHSNCANSVDLEDCWSCISVSRYADTVSGISCDKGRISFSAGGGVHLARFLFGYEGAPQHENSFINYHQILACTRVRNQIITLCTDRTPQRRRKLYVTCASRMKILAGYELGSSESCFSCGDGLIVVGGSDGHVKVFEFDE